MNDTGGATAIEYALIAGIVSIIIVTALGVIGGNLNTKFGAVVTSLR